MGQTVMSTFGSLFAGIGGFDLAFERAGMQCAWQIDIDKQCNDVLATHWPDVSRFKDVRDCGRYNLGAVDLICGGFPCQDLSVAGKRKGLAGERSGLWFEFHRVLEELRPRWVVVENVPGLLSSSGGRDFAILLQGLAELGYGVCWRILDAQFFGVPQRRRRVFVVGSLGDGRSAEVLFEREGGCWNPPPSRETGKELAKDIGACLKGGSGQRGWPVEFEAGLTVAAPLKASDPSRRRGGSSLIAGEFVWSVGGFGDYRSQLATLRHHRGDIGGGSEVLIAKPLTATKGYRANADTETMIAMALSENQRAELRLTPYSRQITAGGGKPGQGYPCVLWQATTPSSVRVQQSHDTCPTLTKWLGTGGHNVPFYGVRRLTPTECERLQGFPDGWTEDQADSTRYRQLGNAVCVNVAEWIGKRIAKIGKTWVKP